jgi:hypothetical protein
MLCNAEHEGGPRNGVMTAIEDFVAGAPEPLTVTVLPVLYGLGVVMPAARLDGNPALGAWLARWNTVDGWAELARLAEEYRRYGDMALQSAAAPALSDQRA